MTASETTSDYKILRATNNHGLVLCCTPPIIDRPGENDEGVAYHEIMFEGPGRLQYSTREISAEEALQRFWFSQPLPDERKPEETFSNIGSVASYAMEQRAAREGDINYPYRLRCYYRTGIF